MSRCSCPILGSVSSKPRQYLHSVMLAVIGGWGSRGSLKSVEAFSICNNTWSSLFEMPDSRSGCGAAVVGGKVYVVGGMDRNRDSMSSVYIYDPSVDTWTSSIPSMQSERSYLGVSVLNDCIYAVGGNREGEEVNTAEVLDMTEGRTQEWRNISNMSTKQQPASPRKVKDKLQNIFIGFQILTLSLKWR